MKREYTGGDLNPELKKVVILAQVPPPFHGQAVIQKHLVDAPWKWCVKVHIPLDFSPSIETVGRFSLAKIWKLFHVIVCVWRERLRGPIDVLYYPPGGPHRIPFFRDVILLRLIRRCARRVVFQFHAGGFDRFGSRATILERLLARAYHSPDLAIVLLPRLAEEIRWIHPKSISVVPNGIADEYLSYRRVNKHAVPVVLSVGAISEEKGIWTALRTCLLLSQRGVNFHFTFVGGFVSDALRTSVQDFVHTHSLSSVVTFRGILDGPEKWDEYARAHIFCFLSTMEENQPVVLLEAMQFSLPVVALRRRAIPDIMGDVPAGVLVNANDPHELAERLQTLLADEQLCQSLGRNGRARFLSEYTLDKHLERLEETFRLVA